MEQKHTSTSSSTAENGRGRLGTWEDVLFSARRLQMAAPLGEAIGFPDGPDQAR